VLRVTRQGIRLTLRVQPRAGRDRVVGPHGQALKLQVAAAPVDGAANAAVVALIAAWLGVPRRAVAIVQGEAARDKVVEVAGDDPQALAALVAARLPGCVDTPKSRG
jgi:uncharacterized protein (TIGR00251 family)